MAGQIIRNTQTKSFNLFITSSFSFSLELIEMYFPFGKVTTFKFDKSHLIHSINSLSVLSFIYIPAWSLK